jgi:hypothetical protein
MTAGIGSVLPHLSSTARKVVESTRGSNGPGRIIRLYTEQQLPHKGAPKAKNDWPVRRSFEDSPRAIGVIPYNGGFVARDIGPGRGRPALAAPATAEAGPTDVLDDQAGCSI